MIGRDAPSPEAQILPNDAPTLLQAMPGDEARFERLLALLRCPKGDAPYRWEPITQADPDLGVYGLLHGADRAWPVIDGIPILLDRPVGAFE